MFWVLLFISVFVVTFVFLPCVVGHSLLGVIQVLTSSHEATSAAIAAADLVSGVAPVMLAGVNATESAPGVCVSVVCCPVSYHPHALVGHSLLGVIQVLTSSHEATSAANAAADLVSGGAPAVLAGVNATESAPGACAPVQAPIFGHTLPSRPSAFLA